MELFVSRLEGNIMIISQRFFMRMRFCFYRNYQIKLETNHDLVDVFKLRCEVTTYGVQRTFGIFYTKSARLIALKNVKGRGDCIHITLMSYFGRKILGLMNSREMTYRTNGSQWNCNRKQRYFKQWQRNIAIIIVCDCMQMNMKSQNDCWSTQSDAISLKHRHYSA